MSLSVRTNLPTFIGLFLVFGLPLIFSLFLKSKYRKSGLFSGIVVHHWSIVFLLFILITLWEHQSLSSIGFRGFSYREILWGFAGFFVGAFSFALTTPLVRALHLNTTAGGITRLAAAPPGLRVVLVLTAGIAEEIMFRGYAIERLATLRECRCRCSNSLSRFCSTASPFLGTWRHHSDRGMVTSGNGTLCMATKPLALYIDACPE